MKSIIQVSDSDERINIRKESNSDFYGVYVRDDFKFSCNEMELKELQKLIEEIIQLSNKQDW